jgi:hypothetical protein
MPPDRSLKVPARIAQLVLLVVLWRYHQARCQVACKKRLFCFLGVRGLLICTLILAHNLPLSVLVFDYYFSALYYLFFCMLSLIIINFGLCIFVSLPVCKEPRVRVTLRSLSEES